MHEPKRLLSSLGSYDHLRQIFCLCVIHGMRNIRASSVPEEIRNDMRSLYCLEHPDWNNTVEQIRVLGGKSGAGESDFLSAAKYVADLFRLGPRQDPQPVRFSSNVLGEEFHSFSHLEIWRGQQKCG
jgi:hypothetical protein